MSDAGRKIIEGLKEAVAGNFSRVHIPDGTGKLQTWARVDAEGGALLTGHADDHCPGCGTRLGELPADPVTIPRAEYEAYRALREPLQAMLDWADTPSNEASPAWITGACYRARNALAALRSAGIHETEGGER